jgi:hypothetical protein
MRYTNSSRRPKVQCMHIWYTTQITNGKYLLPSLYKAILSACIFMLVIQLSKGALRSEHSSSFKVDSPKQSSFKGKAEERLLHMECRQRAHSNSLVL